ncbi:MAG: flippase [Anaerolineae bacterium]|nr:flippase [Anaerolineae bacterium]
MTKNTLAQTVSYAAQVVSRFIFPIFIARLASPENVGDFSFVVTYTMAFAFLTDLGLGWLLSREVARRKDEVGRYVGNAFTVSLLTGSVSLVAMGLLVNLLGYPQYLAPAVYVGSFSLMLGTFGNLLRFTFQAYERMELETISLVVQEGTFLLGGTVVLLLGVPFVWVFVAHMTSRGVGLMVAWILYRQAIGPVHWYFEWPFCRRQIVKAFPFAINMAVSVMYVRFDVLLLSYWHGNTDVGYYEAATNLALRLNVLARLFVTSLMPAMAHAYLESSLAVRQYARAAVRYLAMLSLPLTVGMFMLASPIINLLYGLEEYSPSVLPLQILASMTVLRFLDTTMSMTLTAVDRQGWRAVCMVIAAVANVLLNLVLLPRYTYIGASIATVLTELILFVALSVLLRRYMPGVVQFRAFLRPMLATLAMAILLWFLRDWSLWALVPLGTVVYVGGLFVVGTFSARERRLAQHVLVTVGTFPARRWRR